MAKYYINIEYKGKYYPLFLFRTTSDGSFFVKDISHDSKNFSIIKVLISENIMRTLGDHRVLLEKSKVWSCTNSPKLMHHVDGVVHISGTGITSGFYKFFSGAKGASIRGVNLRKKDGDGGPVMIYGTSDIDGIQRKRKVGIDINLQEMIIDNHSKPSSVDDYYFVLEFFYFLKDDLGCKGLSLGDAFTFLHPNYGIVPMKYIPSSEGMYGYFGIFTRIESKITQPNEKNFVFSLNGGVGIKNFEGEFEQFIVTNNIDVDFLKGKKIHNLDYKGFNKILSVVDNFFAKIKNLFFKI
jgi:hypothetical protein